MTNRDNGLGVSSNREECDVTGDRRQERETWRSCGSGETPTRASFLTNQKTPADEFFLLKRAGGGEGGGGALPSLSSPVSLCCSRISCSRSRGERRSTACNFCVRRFGVSFAPTLWRGAFFVGE